MFIVDSAARSYMGDVDIVVVGADAITSEGNVVNKIGTSSIAALGKRSQKTILRGFGIAKVRLRNTSGPYEGIEQRNPQEVWNEAPEKLSVRNPAFDVTPSRYINGIICEEGVIAPQSIVETINREPILGFSRSFRLSSVPRLL